MLGQEIYTFKRTGEQSVQSDFFGFPYPSDKKKEELPSKTVVKTLLTK